MAFLPAFFSIGAEKSDGVSYNRDIRPILVENCFACHGADPSSRKARLRLDIFEDATAAREDSHPAIVPGKSTEGELLRRIFTDDPDDLMPPEESHKKLNPEQKLLIRRWIVAGAKYEMHWAFIPPSRPEIPRVRNSTWGRNPIDAFILSRLEAEKLKPSGEAERRALIRRVSLDLTGLPPAPAEVEAVLADTSPGAYEKVVDRLLASPRWGEHRGRYWLDAARYGDTHGIHFDNFREMWTYRDWVFNAFNRNMPFDQFTIENLAGDLLPDASRDQKTGSGFNRCNPTTNEGGAIDEEYQVLYARDRTETTSQVWLGLTTGCAVCHDHKYDPISQRDFYSLAAFFNNTTQKAMDGNIKDTPPVLVIPKSEDDERWKALIAAIPGAESAVAIRREEMRAEFTNFVAQPDFSRISQAIPGGAVFHAAFDEPGGDSFSFTTNGVASSVPTLTNTNHLRGTIAAQAYVVSGSNAPAFSGVGDFERTNAFSYATWVRLDDGDAAAGFARLADGGGTFRGWDFWLAEQKPAIHLIHHWPDNAIKVSAKKPLPKNRWAHVCVTYDGSSKAAGIRIFVNGEPQEVNVIQDRLSDTIRTAVPFKIGQRDAGAVARGTGLQDVRLYDRALPEEEVEGLVKVPRLKWFIARADDKRTKEDWEDNYDTWLAGVDTAYRNKVKARDDLQAEQKKIRERGTVAHVMQEKETPAEAHVLFRGEYDKRRDRVTPVTPNALPAMPAALPRNRLGFAQWLLLPENPLTTRVTVNRFWQEVFGTGLVRSSGDFGIAGELPSHPELLDWLAIEFRESGWDVKAFFKLMVMSVTYRQSAVVTPQHRARDPQNRLLARGPRFRMDAEMVRDHALITSGLLTEKVGGPSVRPYQPSGLWDIVGLPDGNTRNYKQDTGADLYRRSVYSFWKRMSPPASMEIFNAPSREICTVRRERTSTPLQALVTLNDPQFVEAARNLAQLSLQQTGRDDRAVIDFMARRLLARPLTREEMKIASAGFDALKAHYSQSPDDAKKLLRVGESKSDPNLDASLLAAATMTANSLMNLDEVLNK
jgi:cytochrome c553